MITVIGFILYLFASWPSVHSPLHAFENIPEATNEAFILEVYLPAFYNGFQYQCHNIIEDEWYTCHPVVAGTYKNGAILYGYAPGK